MSYEPGQIPSGEDAPAPPSVWGPGDVHHTQEQIVEESPGGPVVSPEQARIADLEAQLAAAKGGDDAEPAPA